MELPDSPFNLNLPFINFTAFGSLLLALVSIWALVMGAIYVYHWHRYGAGINRALIADITYFGGLFILIGLAVSLRVISNL